ncbi:GNAT family N-acetyltransferase [Kitasatospora sp. NPDC052896]|uniref:GNAT family N-acetyltransferase n=1 Tax=Kitasatospora sp. NPDC052896 TaxID=3364061 RepID=UPI0037C81C77
MSDQPGTVEQVLARAKRLWAELAGVPAAFPEALGRSTIVVAPESGLCPQGWVGVVVLGGVALLTAPNEAVAVQLRQAVVELPAAALADPAVFEVALHPVEVLGPATLGYLVADEFRAGPAGAVVELAPDDPAVRLLMDGCDPTDVDESGLAGVTSPVFAVAGAGARVLAAAGYRTWPGGAAHLSVLTGPAHRSRGLARQAASAAVAHALAAGLLPQWRARAAEARQLARALGFRELGAQLGLRLP